MSTAAATEIKLIQIGRRALGLDDATYRAMLGNLTGGKTSSTALTAAERQTVLTHMKARGFEVKPRAKQAGQLDATWHREPQLRLLRAMWWQLADAGHVERPANAAACTAAVEAWAIRHLSSPASGAPPLAALRFASGLQMNALIEGMKKWLRRVGLPVD